MLLYHQECISWNVQKLLSFPASQKYKISSTTVKDEPVLMNALLSKILISTSSLQI